MIQIPLCSTVILAKAWRSSQISCFNGIESMVAGDLSTQSLNRAQSLYYPYRHIPPARDDDGVGCLLSLTPNKDIQKGLRRNDLHLFTAPLKFTVCYAFVSSICFLISSTASRGRLVPLDTSSTERPMESRRRAVSFRPASRPSARPSLRP